MTVLDYHRPETVDNAIRLLAEIPSSIAISGGQIVVPALYRRDIRPAAIVDLSRILDDTIAIEKDMVRIGAGACHAKVAANITVLSELPILAALLLDVADLAVRSRATMGGAIASRENASDIGAICLALKAMIETTEGRHTAEAWFDPIRIPRSDEVIIAIYFPRNVKAAYAKFLDPASRYPLVGVMIAQSVEGDFRISRTGLLTDGPQIWPLTELELIKNNGQVIVVFPDTDQTPKAFGEALSRELLKRVSGRLVNAPNTAISIVHGHPQDWHSR